MSFDTEWLKKLNDDALDKEIQKRYADYEFAEKQLDRAHAELYRRVDAGTKTV